MFCPKCGIEIKELLNFCEACGARLPSPPPGGMTPPPAFRPAPAPAVPEDGTMYAGRDDLPPVAAPGTGAPIPPVAAPGTGAPIPPVAAPGTGAPIPPVAAPGTGAPIPPVAKPGTGAPIPPVAKPGTGAPIPPVAAPGTGAPIPPVAAPGTGAPIPPVAAPGTGAPIPPVAAPGTGAPIPPPPVIAEPEPIPPVAVPPAPSEAEHSVLTTPEPPAGNPTSGKLTFSKSFDRMKESSSHGIAGHPVSPAASAHFIANNDFEDQLGSEPAAPKSGATE